MPKTIQVRVDDGIKERADTLFSSLGLDTSTAIRMFLIAAMESGGIPFPVMHQSDRSKQVLEAIERRKSGTDFLSAEQSLENMRSAIKTGMTHEN
jgi:DNA-damage-inducible protein J